MEIIRSSMIGPHGLFCCLRELSKHMSHMKSLGTRQPSLTTSLELREVIAYSNEPS